MPNSSTSTMMGESVSDICAAGEMCNPQLSRCDDVPANPRRFGGLLLCLWSLFPLLIINSNKNRANEPNF